MALRLASSVMTTTLQPCELDPVGAWKAMSMHSSRSSGAIGRSKSRRLRTERVVRNRWSVS